MKMIHVIIKQMISCFMHAFKTQSSTGTTNLALLHTHSVVSWKEILQKMALSLLTNKSTGQLPASKPLEHKLYKNSIHLIWTWKTFCGTSLACTCPSCRGLAGSGGIWGEGGGPDIHLNRGSQVARIITAQHPLRPPRHRGPIQSAVFQGPERGAQRPTLPGMPPLSSSSASCICIKCDKGISWKSSSSRRRTRGRGSGSTTQWSGCCHSVFALAALKLIEGYGQHTTQMPYLF